MQASKLFDLGGKVALVTGGSRGIGFQMAEALGEMGCKLAISARKQHELDAASAALRRTNIEVLTIAVLGMMLTASPLAQGRATKRDAQTMKQKVAAIAAQGARPTTQGQRTTVTESEVNSYLTYELGTDSPTGVVQPSVSALGTGLER